MDGSQPKVKSFDISKRLILEAWEKVRANGGAPGVDAVSISMFEADEISNLYKVWNRMSAGSYMPGPVRGGGDTERSWSGHKGPRCAHGGGIVPHCPVIPWVSSLSLIRSIR